MGAVDEEKAQGTLANTLHANPAQTQLGQHTCNTIMLNDQQNASLKFCNVNVHLMIIFSLS